MPVNDECAPFSFTLIDGVICVTKSLLGLPDGARLTLSVSWSSVLSDGWIAEVRAGGAVASPVCVDCADGGGA